MEKEDLERRKKLELEERLRKEKEIELEQEYASLLLSFLFSNFRLDDEIKKKQKDNYLKSWQMISRKKRKMLSHNRSLMHL